MSFARRQALTAAMTLNALQPVPSYYAGIPAMFGGWLTSELAPHLLTLTALDTIRELARPPAAGRSRPGLALAAGSLAGLGTLIAQSERAKAHVESALWEGLGDDYRDRLTEKHDDLDLSTPLGQLAMPFRMRNEGVEVIKDISYVDHGRRGLLDIYRPRDSLPVYAGWLAGGNAVAWLHWDSRLEAAAGFAAGLVLLVVAHIVSGFLTEARVALARALLTPSESDRLRARVSTLQDSRARVVDAADAERRRIERDLHDGAQQHLVAIAMNLGRAKTKMDSDPEGAKELVTEAHDAAKESITALRNVVRGVRPPLLVDRGLDAALSALAARSPVPVSLEVDVVQPGPTQPPRQSPTSW